jgi:multiple sugar transport system substrate-binding protein
MQFEKLFYVIISSIVITAIILVSYLFPPFGNSSVTAKKIYFVDSISPAHLKVISDFNEKYKGKIEVIAIDLPFTKFSTNERKELLARYLRSKSDRIDIFSVDQIWVPRFAKWGYPLEKHILPAQKNHLLPYALSTCFYNDTLVAVPLYIDATVLYYRDDVLKKLPDYETVKKKINRSITWDDLVKIKGKLKGTDPLFVFQADDFEGLICFFAELMASQGKQMVENGKLQLNSPAAQKALQLMVDLVNFYGASPQEVVKFKEDESYDYYIKSNAAFLRGWPSFIRQVEGRFRDAGTTGTVLMAPNPHIAEGKTVSVFGGWNLMISKYSTRMQEAVIFVNYLLSEDAQRTMYEAGGVLPVNNRIFDNAEYLQKHEDLAFYKELFKSGVHRPFLKNYTNISDVLCHYLHLAIRNQMSVKEALREATDKINSQVVSIK